MKLSEFDYHLPKDLIAQYPADERDTSRLMVISRKTGDIQHKQFRNIIDYLKPGDVLVLNDAKVIPARLYGAKQSGGKVEILLLKELETNLWEALVKGLNTGTVKLSHGITASVSRSNGTARVKLEKDGRGSGGHDIKRSLHEIGVMPLPPYIKRPSG
ncbi:MAG TPA: tRNA preQ1(34) S-adenosylmethionine ribosyltransferase-isomerase QueA, partial [Nitrospirae bacterium]|nr:tRNA preQ1(34) S-adenosylmethionine ribosyltransferase-isomerase QueA [Nitrospirota bacterium]